MRKIKLKLNRKFLTVLLYFIPLIAIGSATIITDTQVYDVTWSNSTNADFTNLYADNLETNLDATGFKITADNFTDGTGSIKGGDLTNWDDINATEFYMSDKLVSTSNSDNITATHVVDADGTADYSTIQAALNDLPSGGKVFVRAGNYNETLNITRSTVSNITLECESGAIIGDSITDAVWLNITPPTGETYTDFTIRGCEFRGMAGGNNPVKNNLHIRTVKRFTLENIRFFGSNGNPNFDNVQEFKMDTVFLDEHRTGVAGRTLYTTNLNNIFCNDGADNCIDVGSIYGLNINNVHCKDSNATRNMDTCIFVTNPNFGYTNINNMVAEKPATNCLQVYVYDQNQEAGKVRVTNSWCIEPKTIGVDILGGSSRNITDLSLDGVNVIGAGSLGMRFNQNVSDFSVTNCIIKDTGSVTPTNAHGIAVYRSYNGHIANNVIINTTGPGSMPLTIATSSDNIVASPNVYKYFNTSPSITGNDVVSGLLNTTTDFVGNVTGNYDSTRVTGFVLTQDGNFGGKSGINIEQLKSKYYTDDYFEMVSGGGLGFRTNSTRRVFMINDEVRFDNAWIDMQTNDIIDADDINATEFYMNGQLVMDASDIDTISELNTWLTDATLVQNDTSYYHFQVRNATDLQCTDCIGGTEISELTDADVSDTLTCSDLVSGSSVVADAEVDDAITVTGYMQDEDINTFSEIQAWVTDATLVQNDTSYYQFKSADLICSDCIGGTEIDESTLTGYSTHNTTYHGYSSKLSDIADDTSPQLGGYLDTNGNDIGSTSDEIEDIYIADNEKIQLGDGQDACIFWNGTNLRIGTGIC